VRRRSRCRRRSGQGAGALPVEAMELKLELESTPEASARARAELRLLEERIGCRRLSDLLLVLTELITNSVKFGPGVQIDVRLDIRDDGSVSGLVVDGGSGRVEIRDNPITEPGGFGLRIVDQLASDWGVRPRTSDVWFELGGSASDARTAETPRARSATGPAARGGRPASRPAAGRLRRASPIRAPERVRR
jgi:anti-sigma regulatory factor (Ser/Thr protein kinase)